MSLREVLDRFSRGPSDVVGIDVGTTSVKAVRMRRSDSGMELLAAEMLPPVDIASLSAGPLESVPPLSLNSDLKAKYGCLAVSGHDAVIKLLSFPGQFDERAEGKVVDNMGLDNPDDYRISYKLISEGHGRSESRVLTVALREQQAAVLPRLLPAGPPAPYSIEVAGLAAMATFLHGPGAAHAGGAVGVVEFSAGVTTFALFNKNLLALVRRFNFGTDALLEKVQNTLGVDRETAQGIVTDGSFDISQSVSDVMEPLVKQLIVSRDFVERRENCHIEAIYASGGLALSHDSLTEIKSSMEVEVESWNPFESLNVAQGAVSEKLAGEEWRFAAAVGACLGTFEET